MSPPEFVYLNSVDWCSDDPEKAAKRLVDLFQLPSIPEALRFALPAHGFDAVFFKAGERMPAAPTMLEFIAANPPSAGSDGHQSCSVPPIGLIERLQHPRPQRIHATNLVARDFEAVIGRLNSRDVPVFLETTCEHLPFPRAWIGWDDSGTKRAEGFDAGLFLEVMPLEAVASPVAESVDTPVPGNGRSRLGARTVLVADLDSALRQLDDTVGLVPGPSVPDDLLGVRTASFTFTHAGSAILTLAEPARPDGFGARYLRDHGPGLFLTSLLFPARESIVDHALGQGAHVVIDDRGGSGRLVLSDDHLPGVLLEVGSVPA